MGLIVPEGNRQLSNLVGLAASSIRKMISVFRVSTYSDTRGKRVFYSVLEVLPVANVYKGTGYLSTCTVGELYYEQNAMHSIPHSSNSKL